MSVLNEPVLVLNRNWQAVTFLPVQVSVVTVMRDMASVLDVENYLLLPFEEWAVSKPDVDRWIKTAREPIPAPEVIVLKKYGERPPRKVVFNRPNLMMRDPHTCQYCGAAMAERRLTVDHVVPRSRKGGTSWENCVAACAWCNARKADKTPEEAGMPLLSQPRRPAWSNHFRPEATIRPAWEPFLNAS